MVAIKKTVKLTLFFCILLFSVSALSMLTLADMENFLTWSENDTNNKLTRTSTRSTWTDLNKNDTAYLYKSTYSYFDFTHSFDFQISSIDVNNDTENSPVSYVALWIEGRTTLVDISTIKAYLWNGTNWDLVFSCGWGYVGTAYEWRYSSNLTKSPISGGLGWGNFSTIAKINNAKLKIVMDYRDPTTSWLHITHAKLEVRKDGQTYWLDVNGRTGEPNNWIFVGDYPYLWTSDGDTSYIKCKTTGNNTEGFTFPDLPKGLVSLWIVSENPTTFYMTTSIFLHVSVYDVGTSNTTFKIFIGGSLSAQNISSTTFNVSTTYYVNVIRAGTSSYSCEIYSETERINLIEKLTATLNAPNQIEYAYVETTISMNTTLEGTDQTSGYVEIIDIGLKYEEPVVDVYTLPFIGLIGIILMVWSPTWVALTIRRRGFKAETVEKIGYAMLLFVFGFGLFMCWIYA